MGLGLLRDWLLLAPLLERVLALLEVNSGLDFAPEIAYVSLAFQMRINYFMQAFI
jgi:hypothetical protein